MLMYCAMERVTKERADDAGERRGRRRPEAKVGALDVRPGAGDSSWAQDSLAGTWPSATCWARLRTLRQLCSCTGTSFVLIAHRAAQTADVSTHAHERVVARHLVRVSVRVRAI